MNLILPDPQDAAQLLRLRILRVTRARERCVKAAEAIAAAQVMVDRREQAIRADRCAIAALAQAVVTSLVPHLPRWSGMVQAERLRLAEQLERDEDALIGESQALEEAREAAAQARIALARAMAREDVVSDLVRQARRARDYVCEQRMELELEDQGRAGNPRAAGP